MAKKPSCKRKEPLIKSWRGAPFVAYSDLPSRAKQEVDRTWTGRGRREGWENKEWWAFAVKADGSLAKSPFVEPIGPCK